MGSPALLTLTLLLLQLPFLAPSLGLKRQEIPNNEKPQYPPLLEYHATRFYNWCLNYPSRLTHKYNDLIPFILLFDTMVMDCNINWDRPPYTGGGSTCFYRHKHYRTNFSEASGGPERVFLKGDPRHVKEYLSKVQPYYQELWSKERKEVIVYVGNSDNTAQMDLTSQIYLKPFVRSFFIEDDVSWIFNKKVSYMPVGICTKDVADESGSALKHAIAMQQPFRNRSGRIFFCFHNGYHHRQKFLNWAWNNCTTCDYCNATHGMASSELWRAYGTYKFIFSPYGNGKDCGRTWEIMLLGAIPILDISEFPGALAYEQGNLSAIYINRVTDINPANSSAWARMYNRSNEPYKLSHDYWAKRIK